MAKFDEYSRTYRFIKMERRSGILQMTLHTDGGPLQWNLDAQVEFVRAFTDVGADRENRIVILTGTGSEFTARSTSHVSVYRLAADSAMAR